MDILTQVHINNDFDDTGIDAAIISLDEKAIKHIFQLARKAGKHISVQEFDYTPSMGTTELDFNAYKDGHPYIDLDNIPALDKAEGYTPLKREEMFKPLEARIDVCQLNVDKTDFWWEGCFKHTDIRWTTQLIPLAFLPQPAKQSETQTDQAKARPDLNMTAVQMNAIHEKIASGMNHGLNAREINRTFNRHVTKAQLIRLLMEHIERNH